MTSIELNKRLTTGRLSKEKIILLVEELIQAPELVGTLLKAIWIEDKNNTFNASWVFDHLMRKKLDYLLPYIDDFANGLENLNSESCIRPMAHVCELLTETYFEKKDELFITRISNQHLEQIVNACFSWLIDNHKMAAKVFSMTSLLYLGMKFDWIPPELKITLENSIAKGSSGYQSRAKKTLQKLEDLGR